MSFIKLLKYSGPFFREMILGKQSLVEVLSTSKVKIFFLFLFFFSITCNAVLLAQYHEKSSQVVAISNAYLTLKSQYDELSAKAKKPPDPVKAGPVKKEDPPPVKASVAKTDPPPVVKEEKKPKKSVRQKPDDGDISDIQKKLESIKKREDRNE